MLARVTYGLVLLALIALVLGIFVFDENNWMLGVSIGLSILCIVLVVFGAARRARYVSPEGEVSLEPETADEGIPEFDQVTSDEVLSAFEDEGEGDWDEEEPEEEEEAAPKRAAAKSKAKKAAPKKKAAVKTKAKSTGTASSTKKVVVVPGRDRYHTRTCRFVKGKDDTEEVTVASAKRNGYEPCSVCNPG